MFAAFAPTQVYLSIYYQSSVSHSTATHTPRLSLCHTQTALVSFSLQFSCSLFITRRSPLLPSSSPSTSLLVASTYLAAGATRLYQAPPRRHLRHQHSSATTTTTPTQTTSSTNIGSTL